MTQENRKADRPKNDIALRARSRRAMASLNSAEIDLLVAAQRAARHAALLSVDKALSSRHASVASAVIHRFAQSRAALGGEDATVTEAVLRRLSAEEATELAQLAIAHAAEKRALKRAVLQAMAPVQKVARQMLRRSSRRQRLLLAVALQQRDHVGAQARTSRARPSFKVRITL